MYSINSLALKKQDNFKKKKTYNYLTIINNLLICLLILLLFGNNGKVGDIYFCVVFFFITLFLFQAKNLGFKKLYVSKLTLSQITILLFIIWYPVVIALSHPSYNFDYEQYLILTFCFTPLLFFFKTIENLKYKYLIFLFFAYIFLNLFFLNRSGTELHSLNGPNILYRQILFFYALILIFAKDKYFIFSILTLSIILLIGSRAGLLIYLFIFLLFYKKNNLFSLNIKFLFFLILIFIFLYLFFDLIILSGVNNFNYANRLEIIEISMYFYNNPSSYYALAGMYPHNIFLEFLIHAGFFGLIFSLIIFYFYIKLYFKNFKYFLVLSPFIIGSMFSGDIFDNINLIFLLASGYHK